MAVVVMALLSAGGGVVFAAFRATGSNAGDSISAGTVAITDNDSGNALMSLTSMEPGDLATGCIQVTYSGSLAADVRIYASGSGALAPYLTLKLTRGTGSGTAPSCTGFTPDGTDYIGQGNGVVYSGSLSSFGSSWSSGQVDAVSSSPETWTNGEVHRYKLEVGVSSDPNGQAKSGTASFIWEARNQ